MWGKAIFYKATKHLRQFLQKTKNVYRAILERMMPLVQKLTPPLTTPCLKDLRGMPHFPWCSAFKLLLAQEDLQLQGKLNSAGRQNLVQHHCSPSPELTWIRAKRGRIILASPDGEQIHALFKMLIFLKYVSQQEVSNPLSVLAAGKEDYMHTLMATFTQLLWEKWIFQHKTTLPPSHYQFNYFHTKLHSPLGNMTTLPSLIYLNN